MRQELPIAPHESGDVTAGGVDMDPTYKYQVYFNLVTNSEVSRNEKTIWDLGFETGASGYHVVLNSAKAMYAYATTKSDFGSVTAVDTPGFAAGKKSDSYFGSLDSTAVGDWRETTPVYIVDMGFDELGRLQGVAKVQFVSVDDVSYTVKFGMLNSSEETTVVVGKEDAYNLSYLSLLSKKQVSVAPPKDTWDIVFSQYTYVFYDLDPPVPYLVTGVLLNRNNTQAYEDTSIGFDDFVIGDVDEELFTNNLSEIGYEWKSYTGSAYVVNADRNYIIKDSKGFLYKLHFIGFYNDKGDKGSPQWEYQRL